MSVVSGSLGAVMGASSATEATRANRHNVKDTNALNKQMFDESRGSAGSAVMPLYLKTRDGKLFESGLGNDLMDSYEESKPDHQATEAAVNRMAPSESAAQGTAAGVWNGGMQKTLESNFQPVKEARVTFARKNALDALHKTLAEINDAQAERGFTGDSMSGNQLRFQANKSAGDEVQAANLQNLIDEQGIKDKTYQYQLANLMMPEQMAESGADFTNLANKKFVEAVQQGLVPLNFLRIGTAQPFQYQGFKQDAQPSAAQLALSSIGQTGNTVLDAWLKNRQAQQYQNALAQQQYYQRGAGFAAANPGVSGGATSTQNLWAGGDAAGAAAGATAGEEAAALA